MGFRWRGSPGAWLAASFGMPLAGLQEDALRRCGGNAGLVSVVIAARHSATLFGASGCGRSGGVGLWKSTGSASDVGDAKTATEAASR